MSSKRYDGSANGDTIENNSSSASIVMGTSLSPFNEKWRMFQLFVGIWVCACNGSIFCFGLLSPTLKREPFNFNQRDINIVSTAAVVLSFMSMPTGYIYDRFGARHTLLAGSVINFLGWMLVYETLRHNLPHTVGSVAVCFSLSQFCASYYETGSLLTNLSMFTPDQGSVVILQKAYAGLGSSIFAVFFDGFFGSNVTSFVLFLALFNTAAGVASSFVLEKPACESTMPFHGMRRFMVGYVVLAVTIIYLTTISVFEAYVTFSQTTLLWFAIITFFLVNAHLLMLPAFPCVVGRHSLAEEDTVPPPRRVVPVADAPCRQSSLLQNIRGPELWLLWWTSFVVWGMSSVITSNSAQIYRAVNEGKFDTAVNTVFVSIFGVANAVGRISIGFLETRVNLISSVYLVAPIISSLAMVGFLVLPASMLVVNFFLSGLATGWSWASTLLLVRFLFAPQHHGKHYNFLYLAGALTPFIFNIWMFSSFYDHYADEQGSNECAGKVCVRDSFLCILGFNATAIVSAFVLHRRCRSYRRYASVE